LVQVLARHGHSIRSTFEPLDRRRDSSCGLRVLNSLGVDVLFGARDCRMCRRLLRAEPLCRRVRSICVLCKETSHVYGDGRGHWLRVANGFARRHGVRELESLLKICSWQKFKQSLNLTVQSMRNGNRLEM
jgi:hypothetical protein